MRGVLLLAVGAALLAPNLAVSGTADLERVEAVELGSGEGHLLSAVIDPGGTYAYFGTNSNPGRVVKVDLATMTQVAADTLTLSSGEGHLWSAIIGSSGTHAYFGTCTNPGRVIEVELATMTRTRSVTLASGDNCLVSAVTDGEHGYFGTDSNPGRVVKVDLATMTRVGAIDLESGENQLKAAVIDPDGTYAYFGTNTGTSSTPARVIKVQLAGATCAGGVACGGMSRVAGLALDSGEIRLWSAVIDPDGAHAYFGTNTAPGRVIKLELAGMTRVGAVEGVAGQEPGFRSAVIDATGSFAYFGTDTDPGRVVKIDLTGGMTRVGAIEFDTGENRLLSAVSDGASAYFGTNTVPGRVIKVGLGSGGATAPPTLTTVADVEAALCVGGGAEVALTDDITDSGSVLTVAAGCTATLDLNGAELTVQRVVLQATSVLTVRDTSPGADGELVAVQAVAHRAGIQTTDATLNVEGGTVTATGGSNGAGIGGESPDDGGTVNITGGIVTAMGGSNGAGIGGGSSGAGGSVNITGGTVTARGGAHAAAIGGGNGRAGGSVTISGGTVTATGGSRGAGIGGGLTGDAGTVTVTGGIVTATGGTSGAGIGGGRSGAGGSVTITGGSVEATAGSSGVAPIGPGLEGSGGAVDVGSGATDVVSGRTRTITFGGAPALTTVADVEAALCVGDGAVVALTDDISDTDSVLTVAAGCTATLDLNGWKLTVQRVVIQATSVLTVRDTSPGADGELVAGPVSTAPGIQTTGATLNVEGGTVTATGGFAWGAGIGGQHSGDGGTVNITGGTVTAYGGIHAAAIGGGENGAGGSVTVTGGTVTAIGGSNGAGIGGGLTGAGGSVTVTGGTVTATGGSGGAGIGGGWSGDAGTVTVTGGIVTATSAFSAAGIGGGGNGGAGGSVKITGGSVEATAGSNGVAPIGPGSGGSGGAVDVGPGATDIVSGRTRTITFGGAPTLTTVADVEAALCAGGGAEVALTEDITETGSVLTVAAGCTATLDLDARMLEVSNVVLGAGSTLTVRDTAGDDDGHLRAAGAVLGAAGIQAAAGSTLRIESGTVTATGGASSAGIGGSPSEEDGGTIEISGGSVTATGGASAAGIGGGNAGAAGTITITGGEVDATAGSGAAAIGGGSGGDGGIIVISGGTVEATGTGLDPIGPGMGGAPGTLTIGTGGVRCEAGLTSSITFDADPADCPSSDPSGSEVSGSDSDLDSGADPEGSSSTEGATGPAAGAPERSEPQQIAEVSCSPATVRPGTTVSCAVRGATPGTSMEWSATSNPVIAHGTLTLDADGNGSIEFVVPDHAAGRRVIVTVADTSVSVMIGTAAGPSDGPIPTSIPAGEGPPGSMPLPLLIASGGLLLLSFRSRSTVSPRRG